MPAESDRTDPLSAAPACAGSSIRIEDRSWLDCDLRSPERNELFVDPAWWKVLADAYGFDVCVRLAFGTDNQLLGAVPWVEVDDVGGNRVVSLPFCDFVDWPMTTVGWNALGSAFSERSVGVAFATPADHVLSSDDRFETEVDGVHHRITVDDPDTMVRGFAELTRRMIKKSERADTRYRLATDVGALEKYHRLHVGVRKHRHGLLAQSPEFFRSVGENFFDRGNGGVLLAEIDGELAGACVLLVTTNAVHYKFAAANPDYYRQGVSHGIVLAALRHTADLGLATFDFGRSDLVHGGLLDFKRRFRPAERLVARHRAVGDPNPRAEAFRSELSVLTELYTDPAIPDDVSAAAGAHLYRYFA